MPTVHAAARPHGLPDQANVGWAKAQRAVPTFIIAVVDEDVGFAALSPPYELPPPAPQDDKIFVSLWR